MHYDSAYTKISANSGVDQGCPLSTCGFSAAVDPVLRSILADICRLHDPGAKLFAYLDDWYLWIKPQYLLQTVAIITVATRSVNLALAVHQDTGMARLLPGRHTHTQLPGWKSSNSWRHRAQPCRSGKSRPPWRKTTQRFQKIATTLADLNAEGLNVQAVNDLLTMFVGAASQHVLRMSFVPEQEAHNFDRQVITFWSHLIQRDFASPLFFLPLKLGGLGVGSAVQRHAAASWRAWQSIIPTLMATTQSPDTDSLFSSTPQLRAPLAQLQTSLAQQMNKPTFQLKPLGATLRLKTTQKEQASTIQRNIIKQFYNSLTDTPTEQAILPSRSTSHTGAHLMQPSSEAYEAEDRCFRVSVDRRLMLPHPEAPNAADVVQSCPNKSAADVICNKPVDPQQHHCYGCRYGGGVDRRHAAVWRCLADVIQTHSGAKVFIEQEVLALTRVVNSQSEHARMDLVFQSQWISYIPGCVHCCSFILQSVPGLSSQHQTRTHGQPAIRDTWSAIQSVHSAIFKQQLSAAAMSRLTLILPVHCALSVSPCRLCAPNVSTVL